ncbi:hypothetical protein AB0B83_06545 [Micromonospora sp. NPDC049060]
MIRKVASCRSAALEEALSVESHTCRYWLMTPKFVPRRSATR